MILFFTSEDSYFFQWDDSFFSSEDSYIFVKTKSGYSIIDIAQVTLSDLEDSDDNEFESFAWNILSLRRW